MCNKDASDQHLEGKDHKWKASGTTISFDFPMRQRFCNYGVVMRDGSDFDAPVSVAQDRPKLA